MSPLIRVGVEGGRRAVLAKCAELGAPLLISANSLWDKRSGKFGRWKAYQGFDVALDSGGFVAMKRYGGYRWTVEQYVQLAKAMAPSWWAQMDFCCEPELAADSAARARRIDLTVEHLHACQAAARKTGAAAPLIVLQGWKAADYTSGPAFDNGFEWPALVGVGSVCRRHLHGTDGVLGIVSALDAKLPPHVRLHLFGVKSGAIREILERWPTRLGSVDSMAWNYAARWDANHGRIAGHSAARAQVLDTWYRQQLRQAQPPAQLSLL